MKEFVSGVFIGGVVVALVLTVVFLADIRQRNRDPARNGKTSS